jgi:16S rRNA (uracil1498-N3)-methyltransferase
VTAPLFLLDAGRLDGLTAGGSLRLDGAEGRHAATVRRIAAGEHVDVADGAGVLARCRVRAAVTASAGRRPDALELDVLEVVREAERHPRFVLVQALAKGGRDDLAIETATELGVDEVVPWQAARSVVVWRGPRGQKSHASWVDTVRAAAKQSRRARVPAVAPVVTTAELAARAAQSALTVVLHEDATTPLAGVTLPADGDVLLVVGPEGGIAPDELDRLTAAGATAARLGEHVLRSSTAGPAALAVLSAAVRWG